MESRFRELHEDLSNFRNSHPEIRTKSSSLLSEFLHVGYLHLYDPKNLIKSDSISPRTPYSLQLSYLTSELQKNWLFTRNNNYSAQ